MKMLGKMLVLISLVVGVLYAIIRLPYINENKVCYNQLMEVYNQKGIVVRHAHLSEEQICEIDKALILKGIDCFRKITPPITFFNNEIEFMDKVAKNIARATKTEIETVDDFNSKCPYRKTKIVYDLNLPDPYIANF